MKTLLDLKPKRSNKNYQSRSYWLPVPDSSLTIEATLQYNNTLRYRERTIKDTRDVTIHSSKLLVAADLRNNFFLSTWRRGATTTLHMGYDIYIFIVYIDDIAIKI